MAALASYFGVVSWGGRAGPSWRRTAQVLLFSRMTGRAGVVSLRQQRALGVGNCYAYVPVMACVALHALLSGGVAISLAHSSHGLWKSKATFVKVLLVPMLIHGLYDTFATFGMKQPADLCVGSSFVWLLILILSLFTNPGSDRPRQTNLLRFQVKAVSGEIDGMDVAIPATQSFSFTVDYATAPCDKFFGRQVFMTERGGPPRPGTARL